MQLTGLQYDSSGNVTQDSLKLSLDTIFDTSGLYKTDTGVAIVSTFPITSSGYQNIANNFIANQVNSINSGSKRRVRPTHHHINLTGAHGAPY